MCALLGKEYCESESQTSASSSDIDVLETNLLSLTIGVDGMQERTKPFGFQPLLKNMGSHKGHALELSAKCGNQKGRVNVAVLSRILRATIS